MALRVSLKKSYSLLARSVTLSRASAPSAAAAPAARSFLAARYLNTSPCPRELVTRSCSRTGVNSVNINHIMKSASVRPATGAERTFSSKATTSGEPSIESQIKANGDAFRREIFGVLYCGALIHKRLD